MQVNKEKFTDAVITYNNSGETQIVVCTNRNFTKILKQLKKCSWITILDITKYIIIQYNKQVF